MPVQLDAQLAPMSRVVGIEVERVVVGPGDTHAGESQDQGLPQPCECRQVQAIGAITTHAVEIYGQRHFDEAERLFEPSRARPETGVDGGRKRTSVRRPGKIVVQVPLE